jgi:hypothetical protein
MIKSKGMKTSGYTERMGEKRNAYGVWLEIPVKREYLEEPRRRWETNTKVRVFYWILLAHDRDELWTVVMNLCLP